MKKQKVKDEINELIEFIETNHETIEKDVIVSKTSSILENLLLVDPKEVTKFKDKFRYMSSRALVIFSISNDLSHIIDENYTRQADGYFQLRTSLFGLRLMLE